VTSATCPRQSLTCTRGTSAATGFRHIALALIIPLFIAGCGGNGASSENPAPADLTPDAASATSTAVPVAMASPAPTATAIPTPTPGAPSIPPYPEDADPAAGRVPAYGYQILAAYPHDPTAYTQGLQYVDGVLYEGTGLTGASSLRRVDLASGAVLQRHDLAPDLFGEGITVIGDRIYQLTWKNKVAFLYDRESFEELQQYTYDTEGWGLTYDGTRLIMSDGSAFLYFRDPETFEEIGRVEVLYLGNPLGSLNELEYINGEVWANIYQTDFIARIDPATGNVRSIIDLTGLLNGIQLDGQVDVLNGIAYDAAGDRLFVTGKWWPVLFQLRLVMVGWANPGQ